MAGNSSNSNQQPPNDPRSYPWDPNRPYGQQGGSYQPNPYERNPWGSPPMANDPVSQGQSNWQQPVQPPQPPQPPVIPAGGKNASHSPQKPPRKAGLGKAWGELFARAFTGALVLFIVGFMGWLYAPRVRNAMTFWPTHTPTPVTPSPTAEFTPSITPLASKTPTLVPTETPGPLSEFWVADGTTIDPPVPDAPNGVIVLHVDQNAEVNPPLSEAVWTSSEKIAADLGKTTYTEKWFATYSSGWIRWFMDQPLREGLYEIYTMDTMYSSGGSLDFSVSVGQQMLTPLTGSQQVQYMTSQYDPVQSADTWRSLGIYFVGPSLDPLTVTTSWQDRDEYTIVSVDRLLIVPRKNTDLNLINALTQPGTKYILDDLNSDINGGDYLISRKESVAWEDSYQLIMNPKMNIKYSFAGQEPWPIGNYKVYAWMPTSRGGITADVQLLVDNAVLKDDSGADTVSITAPASVDGSWVEIGSWTTDRYYERPRKIKLTFQIPEGASGEFPIDAVAFVHTAFTSANP